MSRSKRFEQRVSIERNTLDIVNGCELSKDEPLAGLTAAAINSWIARIGERCDGETRIRFRETLTAIATETGILSDNSRAVFTTDPDFHDRTITSLLNDLRLQCSNQLAG